MDYEERAFLAENRWAALKAWVEEELGAYKCGEMMSMHESIHGELMFKSMLNKMNKLEGVESKNG